MTHQHAPTSHDFKPTRVIKLGKDEEDGTHLYSPATPVKFATLSYRWGSGKQSETRKENVIERSKDLKTSDFPKTLQDAIKITRTLGIEYIWIDRICIVQDDKEDWAKEASLMADIYVGAYVVLSATASEDCQDGFLRKRMEPLVIQYTQGDQESYQVRARQIRSHDCDRALERTNFTLFRRGWCMQERFLARRIIHILPDEILSECQTGRECECGAASQEDHNNQVLNVFTKLRAKTNIGRKHIIRNWSKIAKFYSNMELTYGEDSLPTLSGLAACMEHLKLGKYIVGLWQNNITQQLGFYCIPDDRRRWKYPENVDIVGPTFSWSSHVRCIEWTEAGFGGRSICTLESFEVDPATSNPYGQVRYASLCLIGRVVSGDDLVSWLKRAKIGKYSTLRVIWLDSGVMYNASFTDRTPLDEVQRYYEWFGVRIAWKYVIRFGLCEFEGNQDFGVDPVKALLLQPSNTTSGEYVRIGMIRALEKRCFDENAMTRTITVL
jgi:hypothetical protein